MRKLQKARALYAAFASGLEPMIGWEEIAQNARRPSTLEAWAAARQVASGDGWLSFASAPVSASVANPSGGPGDCSQEAQPLETLMKQAAGWVKRLSVPVLFVGLALLARLWLAPVLHESLPYAFFVVAIIFTAWCAGTIETLLAVGLGYLAVDWFFMTPHALGFSGVRDWISTALYFFVGLSIVWFMKSEQSARVLAFASADQARRQQQRFEAQRTQLALAQETVTMLRNNVGAAQVPVNIMTQPQESEQVRQKVREGYSQIAGNSESCCGTGRSCCGSAPTAAEELARLVGYTADEMAALPEGANLGLSCGNPNALAALEAGEVVLDLGSGGGFDVFIAGRKVGPVGRVIGVDMTPEMLQKARHNLETYRQSGLNNIEFRLGEIEHLPVADGSVDVVISNCVINLSPDKPQVWREIARVLKPGGRVAVSDLALLKPLPPVIIGMMEALIGCISGGVLVSETERMAREAGLQNIELNQKPAYVEGMVEWQDPLYQKIIAHLPAGAKATDYITSLEIKASKAVANSKIQGPTSKEVPSPELQASTADATVSVFQLGGTPQ
jgi:SAM-dependent methyltransferase